MVALLPRFLCNEWFGFIASLGVMAVSGTKYMYSTYAPQLKSVLHYEQYQSNTIALLGNIGNYFGFVPGIIGDVFGPRVALSLSLVLMSAGYFLMYCAAAKWFYSDYILVSLFMFIIGNGCSGCYLAVISSNIKNFPAHHKGKVVGVLLSFYGISSAIFSSVYSIVFAQKLLPFLLFTSVAVGIVPIFGVIFLQIMKKEEEEKVVVMDKSTCINQEEQTLVSEKSNLIQGNTIIPVTSYEIDPQKQINTESPTIKGKTVSTPKQLVEDLNPLQLMLTLDAWIFTLIMLFAVGSAQMIINNMGTMVIAYGGVDGDQTIFVILISIFSCLGRAVFGILSDRYAVYASRTSFFNLCVLLIAISQLGFAYSPLSLFYMVVPVFALAYGGIYALGLAFVSDRFGSKFFSANFCVANSGALVGNYLISVLLASAIYSDHIPIVDDTKLGKTCHGMSCYRLTFLITTGICMLGFALGFLLMHRTSRLYSALNEERKKQVNG